LERKIVSGKSKWKIQHIDLNQVLPELPAEPDYDGVFVVFWWHRIPLGHREIFTGQLPMPTSQLTTLALQTITPTVGNHLLKQGFKVPLPGTSLLPPKPELPPNFQALMALEQPLAELERHWTNVPRSTDELVSVVICTRDRPEQLEKCLRSLQELSPPPDEILVVDNAPTSDAVKRLVEQMPSVRYVAEPRPGLSIARNTGIRCAIGDIIAFTDDDVEVHPDWIARLRYGFQDPNVMVVTGLMLPAELETEAQVAFHRGASGFSRECRPLIFDSQYFGAKKPFGVPVWQIGAGANMALRRKVVDIVGDFDERLGAGAAGCSEDSEFWYRVLAAGWLCRYEPTAVIYHHHRRSMDELKQQMYAYMRGHVAALLIQTVKSRHIGNLFRLLVILPQYYARLIARGMISGFHGRYRTIFVELLGCLAGVLFYLRHCGIATTSQTDTHEDCPESTTSSSVNEFAATSQKQ
jgi:GT2 family glycosyltransferase